jgi:hypothetical protein
LVLVTTKKAAGLWPANVAGARKAGQLKSFQYDGDLRRLPAKKLANRLEKHGEI